jgi:hypothetical protein
MNPLPRPTNRLIPDPIARLFQVKNDVKESSDERMSSIANLREDAGFEGGIGAFEAESEGKGGGAGEAICRGLTENQMPESNRCGITSWSTHDTYQYSSYAYQPPSHLLSKKAFKRSEIVIVSRFLFLAQSFECRRLRSCLSKKRQEAREDEKWSSQYEEPMKSLQHNECGS